MNISFIIPVHASRLNDLDYSIPSIMNSFKGSFEIIVVVNGKNENKEVPDKWENPQIKFYFLEKEGPSVARNYGIRIAKGDWLCFVDSDDSLIPKALDLMYAHGEKNRCDAIIGNFVKVTAGGVSTPNKAYASVKQWKTDDVLNFLEPVLLPTYQLGYVWGRLFRKSFVEKNRIYFNEELYFGEDYEYMVRVCLNAKNIEYLPVMNYSHNVSLSSLTKRFNKLYLQYNLSMLDIIEEDIRPTLELLGNDKAPEKSFIDKIVYSFYLLILSSIIVDFIFHPENKLGLTERKAQFFDIIQDKHFATALESDADRSLDWKHRSVIIAAKRRSFLLAKIFSAARHFLLQRRR